MSMQHLNEVTSVARAAKILGATLPDEITAGLAHIDAMRTPNRASANAGDYIRDLTSHLGNPAAMDKARKAAALNLATAEADAKIGGMLAIACASTLRMTMRRNGEAIAHAFADALADQLATLTAEAPKLPRRFKAENAAALNGEQFDAWTKCRDALERINVSANALDVLYAGAIPGDIGGQFDRAASIALRYAEPPTFTEHTGAYAFRDALTGRANGGSPIAPVTIDALFAPSALAELGATFRWAGPQEVGIRARHIVNAMTAHANDTGTAHAFA